MDALIGMVASKVIEILLVFLTALLSIILARVSGYVVTWFRNKKESSDNILLKSGMEIIEDTVKSAVKMAEQTIVVAQKNGKVSLTKESQEFVKNSVVSTVKENLPDNVVATSKKYNINIDSLIITLIEKTINDMKEKRL